MSKKIFNVTELADVNGTIVIPKDASMIVINNSELPHLTCNVRDGASLRWFTIQAQGSMTSETHIRLLGQGARVEVYGLLFASLQNEINISERVTLAAPQTSARLLTKGVADKDGKIMYHATIHIEKNATGAFAEQRADMLLLSKDASVKVIPDLNIQNRDVQCTHAVTITNLDKDNMFYLQSRGLDREAGKKVSVFAHIAPVYEDIPEVHREMIDENMRKKLQMT